MASGTCNFHLLNQFLEIKSFLLVWLQLICNSLPYQRFLFRKFIVIAFAFTKPSNLITSMNFLSAIAHGKTSRE